MRGSKEEDDVGHSKRRCPCTNMHGLSYFACYTLYILITLACLVCLLYLLINKKYFNVHSSADEHLTKGDKWVLHSAILRTTWKRFVAMHFK